MKKLDIVYEDKYLIIVNKPNGLLTIKSDYINVTSLYEEVSSYLKKQNKNNKVFIIHRLDKDTSGLIMFAKSKDIKEKMQSSWEDVKRWYYAVVEGCVKKEEDTLVDYLKETKTHLVYITNDKKGKLAKTTYERIKFNKNYSLLKINILTGRKNQIRVQLSSINHPIVGDKIYNKGHNKGIKRLCLHAYKLEFKHPITNKVIIVETTYPKYFNNFISI